MNTQIFQLFVGPIPITWCSFYFILFLSSFNLQYPNSPNPVKKEEEEEEKHEEDEEDQTRPNVKGKIKEEEEEEEEEEDHLV